MGFVVFLRAVNVSGRNVSVKAIADSLGIVNVGAAGTFVCEKDCSKAIQKKIPFDADVMAVEGNAIAKLVLPKLAKGEKCEVAVMASDPPKVKLPLDVDGVRVLKIAGRLALCARKPGGKKYTNEVVEKQLGVRATTRGWETIQRVLAVVKRGV